ncbi:tail fiber protein [Synechococcus phage S-H34]|uniref:Tail fiber protein n=1 Tax=Synechococcus phage S-H34 TaxID=2718942 RepID=A0A6G8R6C3_9CAUD|nr:tail collar fiber protein [Synechococcus phage S-H34]QIN96936.1 tail fiber protein [Synechococcus phage S-H34]
MALNFPGSPSDGQTYVAPNGTTYVYDATNTLWRVQGGDGDNVVFVSATAPVAPTQGKMWWNSVTGAMYIYYIDVDGGQWVPAAATGPAIVAPDQDLQVASLVASGDVQAASVNGGHAGPNNLIINGAMQVSQHTTSARPMTQGSFFVDRFKGYASGSNTHIVTWEQDTDVPTGQGFTHSLKSYITTAGADQAGSYTLIAQAIEGLNTANLEWGTTYAKDVTVSFWVKSSIAGTYSFVVRSRSGVADLNRTTEYTISTANTWEHISLVIPGCTTGTWSTDNTAGIEIIWTVVCGSNFQGNPDEWSGTTAFTTSNSVDNWGATLSNQFLLTGVQLTATDTALPFQHEDYGTTLAKCQRYYEKGEFWIQTPGTTVGSRVYYATTKRATPTVAVTSMNYGTTPAVDMGTSSEGFGFYGTPDGASRLRGQYTADAEL